MGLDITAYSKIGDFIEAEITDATDALIDARKARLLWVNPDFPGRADPITKTGVYAIPDDAQKFHFCAGSYSGYNQWRNELARIAGYEDAGEKRYDRGCWAKGIGPFHELIDFSDCEGVIGADVAKRLAVDFCDFAGSAMQQNNDFTRTYLDFMHVFRMAEHGGVVIFH
ncbi:hypothetical protein [Castellaniella sp.]|uniref:hypothetical protein n=1 Tax=Castellaniella sp. TaxID=1955812 RepID=UPI002AFF3D63|nr:hypothetical protein [Castellaniella sp.]